jgi:soluble lytic murein transglycosylase-like protein
MNRVQFAILPSILLGILAIIFFAGMANTTETALASATGSNIPQSAAISTSSKKTATPSNPANRQSQNCSIPSKYPAAIRQWCALIEKYAGQASLDPKLIAAVMLQESGGNPKAYSKSGAVGLMQIMPRDGLAASFQCSGQPCFSSRPTMAELFDPEFNISYGVRMLAGLAQKKGSMREGLRSYGPVDVGYYYADLVLKIYQNYQ